MVKKTDSVTAGPAARSAILAQKYSVAVQVGDARKQFIHDPGLVRTGQGTLIVAAPEWSRSVDRSGRLRRLGRRRLRLARSVDGGWTWHQQAVLPYQEGTPFMLDGRLLMFVQAESHRDFQVVESNDDGLTWSGPSTVLRGPFWNISTAQVSRGDGFFWSMDYDRPGLRYGGKIMVRMDRGKSPLDPGSWSVSNVVDMPELPALLTRNLFPAGPGDDMAWPLHWLEPNTVDVGGRIRVFCRCGIDTKATAGMAAILDYDPARNRLEMSQFAAWPGGQCKFFVLDDAPSGLYWMLSNLVTNSQNLVAWDPQALNGYRGTPGNERRWLFLHYGLDCLNWFPAGCVACWPDSILRSFMYPSAAVDGEDLVILSRTSREAENQHDADLCTVHRVPGFRRLALPLHEGQPFKRPGGRPRRSGAAGK